MVILVFQHVAHEHLGFFKASGLPFHTIELWNNQPIPPHDGFAGLIILGGPQAAYEQYPSRDAELVAIRAFVEAGKPVLGLCLGSQLIAHAFGAQVRKNIAEGKPLKETGYFRLQLTEKGKKARIFKGFPSSFYAFLWHGDVFELPEGASLLAEGQLVKNQAFSYKSATGILFHQEFTPEMVEELIEKDRDWLRTDNEADEKKIVQDACTRGPTMAELSAILIRNWAQTL